MPEPGSAPLVNWDAALQTTFGDRALLAELWRACTHQGLYAGSQDELVRPHDDAFSLIPAAWITARLVQHPASSDRIVNGTVTHYALTETAARAIRNLEAS